MRKFIKILIYSFIAILLIGATAIATFIYKIKYGFPIYETEAPTLPQYDEAYSILLFTKTTGFRHEDAIVASIPAFEKMAGDNNWHLFPTDNGAVFNTDQLSTFDVVIWNNVSGRVLNQAQRLAFQTYVESGGGFVGIHAAGDDSHHWPWYTDTLLGARFSHHSLDPHLQKGKLFRQSDSTQEDLLMGLPSIWTHTDEWYVFFDNPRNNGKQILYTLDEQGLQMSGNIGFFVKDKDWGMGEDHPIIWSGKVGQGKGIYTALGHTAESFAEETNLLFLKNAILWAGSE